MSGLKVFASVRPFTQRDTIRSDIDRLADFFGIDPTGGHMQELTGANASSLSRARKGTVASIRTAEHIAVLAALTWEIERHLGVHPPRQAMFRWLMSGRLMDEDTPRRPIDVLRNPDAARRALDEVRVQRQAVANFND